jgi:hypothetical protein
LTQTRDHLFRQCSWWKNQQNALWKAVRKAMVCKAGRCQHVHVSELVSMENCDQAVIHFLGATDIRKFPPKPVEKRVEK